jgi:hypothetical protein
MAEVEAGTQDTFERFRKKKRDRSTVPQRNTSLVDPPAFEATVLGGAVSADDSPQADSAGLIESLRAEIQNSPEIAPTRNIRIEQQTLDGLKRVCGAHKITIDNFFDAAFELCEEDQVLMDMVIEKAKQRYAARKAIANKRKILTELEKTR